MRGPFPEVHDLFGDVQVPHPQEEFVHEPRITQQVQIHQHMLERLADISVPMHQDKQVAQEVSEVQITQVAHGLLPIILLHVEQLAAQIAHVFTAITMPYPSRRHDGQAAEVPQTQDDKGGTPPSELSMKK